MRTRLMDSFSLAKSILPTLLGLTKDSMTRLNILTTLTSQIGQVSFHKTEATGPVLRHLSKQQRNL